MERKISVIVPTFNQEDFIGRCLRSLLHQSIPQKEYEIIVIDDGSTDKTGYALKIFKDPSNSTIRIIELAENQGLPAALNTGIRSSVGTYIVRVDSDDYVNYNFLSFLSVYLDLNPAIDAVACDYITVDDTEAIVSHFSSIEDPIACGIMFRRHQLMDIGLYDEKFLRNEEKELRIRFEKKYKISNLAVPLYRYRRHAGNITNDLELMAKHEKLLNTKHGPQSYG